MNLAFFDVDQTLYNGYSSRQFFYYVAQKRGLKHLIKDRKQLDLAIQQGKVDQHQTATKAMDLAALVVKDLSLEEVEQLATTVVQTEGLFFPWVEPLISYLQDKQFKIYLVSAAVEPMICAIAKELELEHYFASTLEIVDGMYTGALSHLRNSEAKQEKIAEIMSGMSETSTVIAFGDGPGDIPMLRAADQAFVVSPVEFTDVILSEAEKHHWPILKHETALEQVQKVLESEFSIE